MHKLFNFLLGFMLGVLAGAAIAMLLAPESGEETRRQIQVRKEQVVQEGKRAATETKAELYAQLDELTKGELPES